MTFYKHTSCINRRFCVDFQKLQEEGLRILIETFPLDKVIAAQKKHTHGNKVDKRRLGEAYDAIVYDWCQDLNINYNQPITKVTHVVVLQCLLPTLKYTMPCLLHEILFVLVL